MTFVGACLRNRALMMVASPLLALGVWQLLVEIGVISMDSFTAPVRVVTGRGVGGALLLQVVWAVGVLLLCMAVLAAGERRWVTTGG